MINGRIKGKLDQLNGFENSAFRLNPQHGTARKTLDRAFMMEKHLLVQIDLTPT